MLRDPVGRESAMSNPIKIMSYKREPVANFHIVSYSIFYSYSFVINNSFLYCEVGTTFLLPRILTMASGRISVHAIKEFQHSTGLQDAEQSRFPSASFHDAGGCPKRK